MATLRERLLEVEREIILDALQRCNGVQAHAALELGLTKRSVYYRVRRIRGRPEHVPSGRPETLALRFVVLRRDGFRCRYCGQGPPDRKSTRLNSSHGYISYAVFFFTK